MANWSKINNGDVVFTGTRVNLKVYDPVKRDQLTVAFYNPAPGMGHLHSDDVIAVAGPGYELYQDKSSGEVRLVHSGGNPETDTIRSFDV